MRLAFLIATVLALSALPAQASDCHHQPPAILLLDSGCHQPAAIAVIQAERVVQKQIVQQKIIRQEVRIVERPIIQQKIIRQRIIHR